MKNKIAFYVLLSLEVLTVLFTSIGFLPREAVLVLTGILILYFVFAKIEDSLVLFIVSIPLFVALPIPGYDSMANWRILLSVLFLVWLARKISFKTKFDKIKTGIKAILWLKRIRKFKLLIWVLLFLFVGILSLIVAEDKLAGVKKLLFLINIFLIFPIVRDVCKKHSSKIIKAGAGAAVISLIVGYSQLISTFLVSLHNFWKWWADKVISVFYGQNLAQLLEKSNTWFSYYPDSPPTLRMFSVFPDSHSFALFVIIGLIFLILLFLNRSQIPRSVNIILIILTFLGLAFCGSRGIWVGAAVPFASIIILTIFKKIKPQYTRLFIGCLLIFIMSFPISSLILSASQNVGDGSLTFKRAKSVTDLEEVSVKSRLEIWKASFRSIIKRPVLGVGIGNYPVVLSQETSASKRGSSAHNLYLDIASELGLLGMIVLLFVFWKIFKKSLSNPIFGFFIIWIFVYSLFDVVLLNDKVLLFFTIAIALLYSIKEND